MLSVKGVVGCEVIRNGGWGFTKHVRHDRIQSHIADCERILKAVFLAAFYGYQLIAVAGKLTQIQPLPILGSLLQPECHAFQGR